jgi:hypothetical protein
VGLVLFVECKGCTQTPIRRLINVQQWQPEATAFSCIDHDTYSSWFVNSGIKTCSHTPSHILMVDLAPSVTQGYDMMPFCRCDGASHV